MMNSGDARTAVVLCGGLGTRLRAAVDDRPKVLAEVAGRPLLDYQLQRLQDAGVTRVILSAAYLSDQLVAYAANADRWRMSVEVIIEDGQLGTGGALALAVREGRLTGAFLAINGDTLASVSIPDLLSQHAGHSDALATIAVVQVADRERYGSVEFDGGGRVLSFREKAQAAEVKTGDAEKSNPLTAKTATTEAGTGAENSTRAKAWINAGVYVLEPRALSSVRPGEKVSLEYDLFPTWLGRLFVLPASSSSILDIGTPEDYARAPAWLEKEGWIQQS